MFYGHMRHLLSAMSVRLWIVMYNETEIGAELGSVFAEEHAKWALQCQRCRYSGAMEVNGYIMVLFSH